MPELKHKALPSYLKSLGDEVIPSLIFIWGERFLCRKIFDGIIDFLLPGKEREIGYELLEGDDAVISVMIERLSTFSVFQKRRVVAARGIPIFSSQGTAASQSVKPDDLVRFKHFIEKGIPEDHFLVLTSETADRRKGIFSIFKERGLAIDCTVPKGDRKADQGEKTALLRFTMDEILVKSGKNIDGNAFQRLTEMTGFEPATFADDLERLVAFIGDRKVITLSDVESIVKRTKQDALFELNNAVSDKKLEASIFYFNSLTKSGFHPLQLHAALTNHFRKLFVVKNFILGEREKGNVCWRKGNRNYNLFMKETMPWIVKSDEELLSTLAQWERSLEGEGGAGTAQGKGKGKKKPATDLLIAPNPKNGYPVFQLFLKSDLFTFHSLCRVMAELAELDYQLKTSSDGDPNLLLEAFIINICMEQK